MNKKSLKNVKKLKRCEYFYKPPFMSLEIHLAN